MPDHTPKGEPVLNSLGYKSRANVVDSSPNWVVQSAHTSTQEIGALRPPSTRHSLAPLGGHVVPVSGPILTSGQSLLIASIYTGKCRRASSSKLHSFGWRETAMIGKVNSLLAVSFLLPKRRVAKS